MAVLKRHQLAPVEAEHPQRPRQFLQLIEVEVEEVMS